MTKDCEACGTPITKIKPHRFERTKYCSRKCSYPNTIHRKGLTGRNAKAYKGGRWIDKQGYVYVLVGEDSPFACMRNSTGYVMEHRLVMAKRLKRPLIKTEEVHHKNGKRVDNRLRNLELWTKHQPPGVRVSDAGHCPTCTCHHG